VTTESGGTSVLIDGKPSPMIFFAFTEGLSESKPFLAIIVFEAEEVFAQQHTYFGSDLVGKKQSQ